MMKRYKIIIKLTNGDYVEAAVVARNGKDAIRRLRESDQFRDFAGNADIEEIEINPIETKPIDNNRFSVTDVLNKQGWYVVADLDNLIEVEFRKGHYNDMQNIHMIDGGKQPPLSPLEEATALREIGEFMADKFAELVK